MDGDGLIVAAYYFQFKYNGVTAKSGRAKAQYLLTNN